MGFASSCFIGAAFNIGIVRFLTVITPARLTHFDQDITARRDFNNPDRSVESAGTWVGTDIGVACLCFFCWLSLKV